MKRFSTLLLVLSVCSGPPGATECEWSLTDVAVDAGLTFRHERGASVRKHLPETMGAGLAWLEAGDPLAVPAAQVLQVFVLPFVFGLVSQAAAFRRAAARVETVAVAPRDSRAPGRAAAPSVQGRAVRS